MEKNPEYYINGENDSYYPVAVHSIYSKADGKQYYYHAQDNFEYINCIVVFWIPKDGECMPVGVKQFGHFNNETLKTFSVMDFRPFNPSHISILGDAGKNPEHVIADIKARIPEDEV